MELNQIRCGKKIYYFDEVNIDTAIELKLNGISMPHKYLVRDVARKTMEEISLEIAILTSEPFNGNDAAYFSESGLKTIKSRTNLEKIC